MTAPAETKTWIDFAALAVSLLAFLLSLWTNWSQNKWKQEVEIRRPFVAELQKLAATVGQHILAIARYEDADARLARAFADIEEQMGGTERFANQRQQLDPIRDQQKQAKEQAKTTEEAIDAFLKIKKPSSEQFAWIQERQIRHTSLVLALEAITADLNDRLAQAREIIRLPNSR